MNAELSLDDINAAADMAAPTDNQLATVAELAQRQLDQEQAIALAELALKELKAQHTKTQTVDLPAAMAVVNLRTFTLASGHKVELENKVYAQISEARKAGAHEWLRKNNHGDIIKNVVTADFKAGEEELATEFVTKLVELFPRTPFSKDESVHAGTLKAFVREQLDQLAEPTEAGVPKKEFPEALFGVYRVTEAKVTAPKPPKVSRKK